METRSDFNDELLAALSALEQCPEAYPGAPDKERDARFMKAAVCLRTWYRHEAITHKPELVVTHTKDSF